MSALRRFFGLPWLLPFTALVLRARTVRPSAPFAIRELLRRPGTQTYQLAANGLQVAIRHRSPDVVTLGEVFHDRDYVPPPDVERLLSSATRIVDLGANVGLFGAFAVARWPQAAIVAYEPDPENVIVHERTIAANGLGDRWRLVPAAAGAQAREARFEAGRASLSRISADTGADGLISVSVHDVLDVIAEADLLKVDIEGGEWEILGDERFRQRPPRVLVLEYHPHLCPREDPRAAAESVLRASGMTIAPIKHAPEGHGMLWAWRT